MTDQPRFEIGQVISHRLFGYRGVIVDVDPEFAASQEWYETVATTRPPKDKPWYHVLVHDHTHMTYVAERHLQADTTGEQINHPALGQFFSRFLNGRYFSDKTLH